MFEKEIKEQRKKEKRAQKADKKRFDTVLHEYTSNLHLVTVVRDKQTGVQYLIAGNTTGIGITVMVDKDGKPLVDNND